MRLYHLPLVKAQGGASKALDPSVKIVMGTILFPSRSPPPALLFWVGVTHRQPPPLEAEGSSRPRVSLYLLITEGSRRIPRGDGLTLPGPRVNP